MGQFSRGVIKSSMLVYISAAILFTLSFLTSVALARLLDKELWGLFSVCLTIVSVLAAFVDLGLSYSLMYFCSRFDAEGKVGKIKAYVSVLLRWKLLLVFAVCALLFLLSGAFADAFHAQRATPFIQASAAYLALLTMFTFFDSLLTGLKKFKEYTIASVVSAVVKFIFAPALVFYGFGVGGALLGFIASAGVGVLLMWLPIRYLVSLKSAKGVDVKDALSLGFYAGIINIAGSLLIWIDSFMVGMLMDPVNVGFYRIAATVATAVFSFTAMYSKVISPMLIGMEAVKNRLAFKHYYDKSMEYGFFIAAPLCFGLALLSTHIVRVFFGVQYVAAAPALFILSYLCADGLVTTIANAGFTALKRPDIIAKITVLFIFVNVALNMAFIPWFGIVGASFAALIARLANFGLEAVWLQFKFGIGFRKWPVARSLISACLMSVVLWPFVQNMSAYYIPLVVAVGAFIYLAAQRLLGCDSLAMVKKLLLRSA